MRLWLRRHEKAPTTQAGGKAKAADQLVSLIRGGREYREPFAGSGAVFFEVARRSLFASYWLNDIDPGVTAFLTTLRDRPDELAETIMAVRDEFRDEREADQWARGLLCGTTDPFWLAVAQYVVGRTSFSSQGRASSFSRTRVGERFSRSHVEKLPLFGELLRGVQITCGDYEDVVSAPGDDVTLFLDPRIGSKLATSMANVVSCISHFNMTASSRSRNPPRIAR